ncbi:MAG: phosphate transport system regulatory protein PhoU [Gammaproteobacteria bacterium]|nr:MAG: phosphate transport system regulatory protein PhoU [Gammaproteobacteria bacterium]
MHKDTFGQHTSRRFNEELEDIRNDVMAMGGLVEKQTAEAIESLLQGDVELADQVIENDYQVNHHEVSIDNKCTQLLARRQPTATDLRFIIAVIKTITDLERIGDQACRVAVSALKLAEMERPANHFEEIRHLGDSVEQMLRQSLDAFARFDIQKAALLSEKDEHVDIEYEGIMRQHITYMLENPRSIKRSLQVIWAIRAIERIGDHSQNIGEYVIYLVKGKDVRHTSPDDIQKAISEN